MHFLSTCKKSVKYYTNSITFSAAIVVSFISEYCDFKGIIFGPFINSTIIDGTRSSLSFHPPLGLLIPNLDFISAGFLAGPEHLCSSPPESSALNHVHSNLQPRPRTQHQHLHCNWDPNISIYTASLTMVSVNGTQGPLVT